MRYLICLVFILGLAFSAYASDKGDCYEYNGAIPLIDYERYDDHGVKKFRWLSSDPEPDCSSWGQEVDDWMAQSALQTAFENNAPTYICMDAKGKIRDEWIAPTGYTNFWNNVVANVNSVCP